MTVVRVDDQHDDPAIEAFLKVLAADFPTHLQPFPFDLLERANALVGKIEVDPDESIEGEVAL